jgi:hypothetical protein
MRRAAVQIALVLVGVAAFLALLLWLHPTLLDRLRGREPYALPLSEVQCPAPPGLDRRDFLDEVAYYASLPDRLDLLDEGLAEKLKRGFAQHPWVKEVGAVRMVPPRQVHVELKFRRPVLAIRVGTDLRAVDEAGILLPKNAPVKELRVLEEDVPPPKGAEGTPWGDPRVERAARFSGR